jgi:hypothetical protein
MVQNWVKDLVEGVMEEDENIVEGKKLRSINSPEHGQIVYQKEKDVYTRVRITEGKFWGTHGVSNFWYWEILDDNNEVIGKDHGYGNFYVEV